MFRMKRRVRRNCELCEFSFPVVCTVCASQIVLKVLVTCRNYRTTVPVVQVVHTPPGTSPYFFFPDYFDFSLKKLCRFILDHREHSVRMDLCKPLLAMMNLREQRT